MIELNRIHVQRAESLTLILHSAVHTLPCTPFQGSEDEEGGSDSEVDGDFEDVETGERYEGGKASAGTGDAVTDAALKAIREAEAEEMRAKKAAQKAMFNAQVRAKKAAQKAVFNAQVGSGKRVGYVCWTRGVLWRVPGKGNAGEEGCTKSGARAMHS